MTTLMVVARSPVAGRVKTRLVPPYSYQQAAELAEASLIDTLHAVLAAPARRRLLILDGSPGSWLPAGFDVIPQVAGDLDERIAAAFAHVDGPALIVGMDTPQLSPELLTVSWADADAWFGPATDGGFWALGLRRPDPNLIRGVPMSSPDTGAVQRDRLLAAGLRVVDLPELRDVDTAADASAVAAGHPATRFARRLRQLAPDGLGQPAPDG
ncbi:MAG: glycosyltransferase [Sporichthyaceae bacterium]|nr:glycosyltransferase [Sporichthyaceae bacterium]